MEKKVTPFFILLATYCIIAIGPDWCFLFFLQQIGHAIWTKNYVYIDVHMTTDKQY